MKISKLFHWLYACLMFLPILVFIPSILFYAFNKDAKVPEVIDIQYNYQFETNEVNDYDDLVIGNIYYLNDYLDSNEIDVNIYDFNIYLYKGNFDFQASDLNINIIDDVVQPYPIVFSLNNADFKIQIGNESFLVDYWYIENIDFTYTGDFPNFCDEFGVPLASITTSEFNYIESVDVVEDDTPSISTVVSKAWVDTWHNALFSWSYDSFLTAPFLYITGLFGIPADSTLNFTFSYWLSISIIWLVFDLVMYVPLLVHRWIDKAGID